MDNFTFNFFRELLETLGLKLDVIIKKDIKMAQTLADLQTAIASIAQAVSDDAAQDQLVIAAIEKVLAKIGTDPDYTAEVTALTDAVNSIATSNSAVKDELDKVATL